MHFVTNIFVPLPTSFLSSFFKTAETSKPVQECKTQHMRAPANNTVKPRRLGLKYEPPTVVLEYLETTTGRLLHKSMRLKRLRPSVKPLRVVALLRATYPMHLEGVADEQLERLVERLINHVAQSPNPSGSLGTPAGKERPKEADVSIQSSSGRGELNLNLLSNEELNKHKRAMDESFLRARELASGEYDVRKEFAASGDAGWDD